MDIPREIEGARVLRAANLNDATAPGGTRRYSGVLREFDFRSPAVRSITRPRRR